MARVILGIDPGLASTGWGVVTHSLGWFRLLAHGMIKTKFTPGLTKTEDCKRRSEQVVAALRALVADKQPDQIAMEAFV